MLWSFAGLGTFPDWIVAILGVVDMAIRIIALGVIPGNRRPNTAMAWLLAIFFIPLLGLLLFFMFGSYRLSQRRIAKQADINQRVWAATHDMEEPRSEKEAPAWVHSAAELNRRLGAFPMVDSNHVELYPDYDASIAAMTESVREAREFVNIEFYIMSNDSTTSELFVALEEAAARGVRVRLLFDHIGTLRVTGYRKFRRWLETTQIDWRRSLPVLPVRGQWRRIDLRNHRKILVVDGRVAFTGSQNLIEPGYRRSSSEKIGRKWVELMARYEGPIVTALNVVFATDWLSETEDTLEAELFTPVPFREPGPMTCQALPSGPGFATENNLRLFNTLIYAAVERLSICSPYFVPDDSLLYAITTAAQRGVEVELFVSELGDQAMVHHAQQSYYQALLEAGVRIYRYPKPLVLHAKHFTVDNEVAVIGSSNMDMRSFSLNMEVSVMMLGDHIVEELSDIQDSYRVISKELTLEEWKQRPRWQRYVDNVARLTATLQ
ncbi:cardiolipin synthase [Arthrobacter sp. CAU 1506]|uniref:cardiolipin synthase n=1 Tax=Arthrobacter sp. CAU 1506 TaxID=2560052 RepID=UPI00197A9CEC|nr:cardiolipin synthase [Arthrobacter sp. CAU 1506]